MRKPIDSSNLDPSTNPSADFYQYANGGWLKKHPIPDEFSRYGTFDLLREENKKLVRNLIEEISSKAADDDPVAQLIGSFYRTGMDQETIDQQKTEPIEPILGTIDSIADKNELQAILTGLFRDGIPVLFHMFPTPDRENAEMVIANFYQGGMGLPEVEYYRKNDDRSKAIRATYRSYISRMFEMSGEDPERSAALASSILAIESRLAHSAMTLLERRNPHATFHKMKPGELGSLAPSFDWSLFLEELNLPVEDPVNVSQPAFFKEVSTMLEEIPLESWKSFLKWRILNSSAPLLSSEFEKERFRFYGTYLSGKEVMQPRWKRVTSATEAALGEALGKVFVANYFPPEAKKRMLVLVENLRKALHDRIQSLEWMAASTKKEALDKLSKMRVKIGYPDKWRDFSQLSLSNRSFFEDYLTASRFNQAYELDKIGKPVDPDEWGMTPQTVNAYYHPMLNEIVFPAGILQPPFFYLEADDAVNYGAIGVVIGHEMTHGFDDQGRKYDHHGNLRDWWSKEDSQRFEERARVLTRQFNNIPIMDELYANGELTLGENIADLGGVNIALSALRKAWSHQNTDPEIDGFTPLQRFFLSYAHLWANNIRDKEKIRLTHEDVHSLGVNRVNGILPNVDEFYEAFSISDRSSMYVEKSSRARIW